MLNVPADLPNTYRAFGLTIGADIELAGFTSCDSVEAPDVVVRQGVPRPGDDQDSRVGARAEGTLRASVWDGREIIVEALPDADPLYVSAIVTGELFSVLLRQRGLLVLHGSGVARDGQAIGFIGESGWGKSTLASALVDRGWSLLTDDLLVVAGLGADRDATAGTTSGALVVIPAHPSMRLSSEAIERADGAARTVVGQAHALTTKLRVDHGGAFSDQPTALVRLYVLDPRSVPAHRAVPLSAREAVQEFVVHTRGSRLLQANRALQGHLGQCAELARRVPTASLQRRFGLEHVETLCDFVEAEMATR